MRHRSCWLAAVAILTTSAHAENASIGIALLSDSATLQLALGACPQTWHSAEPLRQPPLASAPAALALFARAERAYRALDFAGSAATLRQLAKSHEQQDAELRRNSLLLQARLAETQNDAATLHQTAILLARHDILGLPSDLDLPLALASAVQAELDQLWAGALQQLDPWPRPLAMRINGQTLQTEWPWSFPTASQAMIELDYGERLGWLNVSGQHGAIAPLHDSKVAANMFADAAALWSIDRRGPVLLSWPQGHQLWRPGQTTDGLCQKLAALAPKPDQSNQLRRRRLLWSSFGLLLAGGGATTAAMLAGQENNGAIVLTW